MVNEVTGPDGAPLAIGGNQFSVIFELPKMEIPEWKTVDHSGDKSVEASLKEVIAGAHRPSQPIEDPLAKVVEFPEQQNYDPLSSHKIGGNSYIKPKH